MLALLYDMSTAGSPWLVLRGPRVLLLRCLPFLVSFLCFPVLGHAGEQVFDLLRVRHEETVLAGLKLLSQIFADHLDAAHATASALRSVVDAVAFGLHSKHCQIATLGYGLLQQALLHGQLNRVAEQMQPALGTVSWIWHGGPTPSVPFAKSSPPAGYLPKRHRHARVHAVLANPIKGVTLSAAPAWLPPAPTSLHPSPPHHRRGCPSLPVSGSVSARLQFTSL